MFFRVGIRALAFSHPARNLIDPLEIAPPALFGLSIFAFGMPAAFCNIFEAGHGRVLCKGVGVELTSAGRYRKGSCR
jgi:hypothetical protein